MHLKSLPLTWLLFFCFTAALHSQTTVHFSHNQHALSETEVQSLDAFVSALSSSPSQLIVVTGHTDDLGSSAYNLELSKSRAEMVASYLIGKGVDPSKVQTKFKGESDPLVSHSDGSARQANRRVEVELAPIPAMFSETAGNMGSAPLHLQSEIEECSLKTLLTNVEVSIPDNLLIGAAEISANAGESQTIKIPGSQTVIYVPANALRDKQGKTVQGNVTITFTDYRNSAHMAFSNLPMTYIENGEELFMNSSGMFEIRAYQNGEVLAVDPRKSITVDYETVNSNEDVFLFQLDEEAGEWRKGALLDMEQMQAGEDGMGGGGIGAGKLSFWQMVAGFFRGPFSRIPPSALDPDDRESATLLAGADAGHSYPAIVRGLNVRSFGVYNCDQIYRVADRVNILAEYKDSTGTTILDGEVLSMIDMAYNGAFSFGPQHFSCSASGDNVLLLFTKSDRLFLLERGEFAKMEFKSGAKNTFVMKDVTDKITSTEDLAEYLGIKI